MKKRLGIYLHIPFCIKKCLYCDFCSFPDRDGELMRRYVYELCRRIKEYSCACEEYTVDTVYFGGGTPTLLPIECFASLFDCLRESFDISENCEISCECNPASADKDYLRRLRNIGVNRLSIGLQSADDGELAMLGRAHSFEDFKKIFFDAREIGFDNISADLMYGIPNQTKESFEKTLSELIALSPEHISVYGLKIEDRTPFAKMQEKLILPDEDTEYEMYLMCSDILGRNGYKKYEISNFSKRGRESKHNLRYWKRDEYLGFGVAAHSFFENVRFGNSRDMEAFLRGEDICEGREAIDKKESLEEYVMLSMRLSDGIDLDEFERRYGISFYDFYPRSKELIRGGFLNETDGHIAFTDKGFFVSNTILADMIGDES